jgi:F0F1-type ATP synthase membrane subunit a
MGVVLAVWVILSLVFAGFWKRGLGYLARRAGAERARAKR